MPVPLLRLPQFLDRSDAPDVSEAFCPEIEALWQRTPANVVDALGEKGWKAVMAPYALSNPNELAYAVIPTKRARGSTAMGENDPKVILYWEHNRDPLDGKIRREVIDYEDHIEEIGHALDRETGLSASPAFIKAHAASVARLDDEIRGGHSYYADYGPGPGSSDWNRALCETAANLFREQFLSGRDLKDVRSKPSTSWDFIEAPPTLGSLFPDCSVMVWNKVTAQFVTPQPTASQKFGVAKL